MSVAGATAYFGFGALMNKISLRMRGICPQSSCAAKLPGFCLVFGGSHGMATVLRSKTDAVHGVLYMVSCEEKKRLDSTESSYEELEAHVETRNGELVLCTLNVMRPDVMENFYETLPSERYLAVMIEGATQHNLPASWIEMLRRTGCVPRSLYRSFPVSSELSLFTPAQRPGSAHADHAAARDEGSHIRHQRKNPSSRLSSKSRAASGDDLRTWQRSHIDGGARILRAAVWRARCVGISHEGTPRLLRAPAGGAVLQPNWRNFA